MIGGGYDDSTAIYRSDRVFEWTETGGWVRKDKCLALPVEDWNEVSLLSSRNTQNPAIPNVKQEKEVPKKCHIDFIP